MVRGGVRVPARTDLPPSLATFDRIDGGQSVAPVVPKPTAAESAGNQVSK